MVSRSLRADAEAIWRAGVDAVRSERLVQNVCRRDGSRLEICGDSWDLRQLRRIVVVGAGKAGAGMAAAVENVLGPEYLPQLTGWVNVPADCVRSLQQITLHPARPAGVNEPTAEGVTGGLRMLELVSSLGEEDLCLVLLSGGGSALLPVPVPEITLADKQAVTRFLMHSGATIHELNAVRKRLSRIKGGGLARACTAGTLVTLIISDVVGDPLDVIASGPTVPDPTTNAEALAILQKFDARPPDVPQAVLDFLGREALQTASAFSSDVRNHVIGNNGVAVTAAAAKAEELGYRVQVLGSGIQGEANAIGRELIDLCISVRDREEPIAPPACVLSGGEPIVQLAKTSQPRKGGRNQQLVLAALEHRQADGLAGIALLSGGTDGEDGPTDAAGAVVDAPLLNRVRERGLDPAAALAINDAYTFFEQCDGLLKTGPTHTNVMDLRVGVVRGDT